MSEPVDIEYCNKSTKIFYKKTVCFNLVGECVGEDLALRHYCGPRNIICIAEKYGFWQKRFKRKSVIDEKKLVKCPDRNKEISDFV